MTRPQARQQVAVAPACPLRPGHPMHIAQRRLQVPVSQQALERDITALLDGFNTDGARSLLVPSEYAEVIVTKPL